MTVDVDAVSEMNEKLAGLVNLLQLVGIDGAEAGALIAEQNRQSKDGGSTATPKTAGSSESQILEIVKKLQQAQADSPEILAALKSPELKALANLAAQKQKAPAPAPAASLNDVMDDEDDNYPKIGPGYSDDISVVSDLTTPTVMTKQNVAEEEYYKDVNGGSGKAPPMNIGGPIRPPMSVGGGTGKTKNRLGTVNPQKARNAIAKTGGAAAQRRINYQQAMAKLQEPETKPSAEEQRYMDGFDTSKQPTFATTPKSSDSTSDKKSSRRKGDPKRKSSSRKKSSKTSGDGIDWGTGGDMAWPSFDKIESNGFETFGGDPFSPTSQKSKIDGDGFFASDPFANSDPFAPVSSSSSHGTKKKKKKSRDDGQGTRTRRSKDGEKSSGEKSKRRQRRASLQM